MEKQGKIADKYKRTWQYLRSQLLMIAPGDALPGIRQMTADCHCGKDILLRAIQEAETAGLLERRPKSGYYRIAAAQHTKTSVAVFADPYEQQLEPVGISKLPSYAFSIVLRLQTIAQKEKCSFAFATRLGELPEEAETLFAVCIHSQKLMQTLKKKYTRVIAISGCGSNLWAKPPYGRGTSFGVAHLASLGHRRIGFLHLKHHNPWSPDLHLYEYYRTMAKFGFQVPDHFVASCAGAVVNGTAVRSMLCAPKRPTAILTLACWLPAVYQILTEMHIAVPSEMSVLGVGIPGAVAELSPTPSLVYDSPEDLADAAWKMRREDPQREMVFTPGLRIFPGKSLRHLPR